jgi:cell division septal protein FtsQ
MSALRTSAGSAEPRTHDGRAERRALSRGLVVTLAAFALYAGTCAALWRVGRRGADAFVIVPDAIDRTRAPAWLPSAEIARVNALGNSVRGRSVLDPDLTRDLAACYEESPWVSRVIHVRRVYPNRLDVKLAIRRPFAVVERGSGPPVVLDRTGVRLPASAESEGLPRLAGVVSPAPAQGAVWQDVRILDGLKVLGRYGKLLDSIAGRNSDRQTDDTAEGIEKCAAREVRVGEWSRADARPVVEIVTAAGWRVVWGVELPAGVGTVTGPPAHVKLARLADELPRLARSEREVDYLDVRHRSGAVVRLKSVPGGTAN